MEHITDPAELLEANKAWVYVQELIDAGYLDEWREEPEDLAFIRQVFERARSDAIREASGQGGAS